MADSKSHMVSRWRLKDASVGQLVAGGRGPGDDLEQLNRPTAVAVDAAGCVYVSDARLISSLLFRTRAVVGRRVLESYGWLVF